MTVQRADLSVRMTDQISGAIKAGISEFRMPWPHENRTVNVLGGHRGANVLRPWLLPIKGYGSGRVLRLGAV